MAAIQITDEALKSVLSAAVLQSISTEERDKLLTEAINHWLGEKQDSSYNSRTKLQVIISSVLSQYAEKVVRERMESDTQFKDQVTAALNTAIDASVKQLQETVVQAVIVTVQTTLQKMRDRY